MKINKKVWSASVKLTKNYQSINLTEGFEVEVDKDFDEFSYEAIKQDIKDRLVEEANKYINNVTNYDKIDLEL